MGTEGKAAPGVALRIATEPGQPFGEVLAKGPNVFSGYWKNEAASRAAFTPDGWFRTGDRGLFENGYLRLQGRIKEMIHRGGENISSQEVEDLLHGHPAVMLAAVVAQPDPKWGETPCAFVELKEGASATAEELIEFCRANLAHFKAPKSVYFQASPRTSTGKVQKFVLRERLWEGHEKRISG